MRPDREPVRGEPRAEGRSGAGPPEAALPAISTTRLYSYLVTRHTGRAVRMGIERRLEEVGGAVLAVLDFHDVPVIDFSCADEIVVKLVRGSRPADVRVFLFRGLSEHHRDPIESALARQRAVVAAEDGKGRPLLLGCLEDVAVRTWHEVREAGRIRAGGIAARLAVDERAARRGLERLAARRLVWREGEHYLSLWRVLDGAHPPGDLR